MIYPRPSSARDPATEEDKEKKRVEAVERWLAREPSFLGLDQLEEWERTERVEGKQGEGEVDANEGEKQMGRMGS